MASSLAVIPVCTSAVIAGLLHDSWRTSAAQTSSAAWYRLALGRLTDVSSSLLDRLLLLAQASVFRP